MTTNKKRHSGQFKSGDEHPRASNLQVLELELIAMPLGSLAILPGTIIREGRYRKVSARCSLCGNTYVLYVDNILRQLSKGCRCQQRRGKYQDPRADMLGTRYDAMVQRCTRETHVSWRNYKGRGIKVMFTREEFIRWALAKFPDTDFKGLDFDRMDNDGHYETGNLRLVPRSVNLRNRRRSRNRYRR